MLKDEPLNSSSKIGADGEIAQKGKGIIATFGLETEAVKEHVRPVWANRGYGGVLSQIQLNHLDTTIPVKPCPD